VAGSRRKHRTAARGQQFRRHELELPEGDRLVLHADGSIEQLDAAAEIVSKWAPDDPDWPRHAIRFGLFRRPGTVAPPDARERGSRLPGG
jgi:hypothetical protein